MQHASIFFAVWASNDKGIKLDKQPNLSQTPKLRESDQHVPTHRLVLPHPTEKDILTTEMYTSFFDFTTTVESEFGDRGVRFVGFAPPPPVRGMAKCEVRWRRGVMGVANDGWKHAWSRAHAALRMRTRAPQSQLPGTSAHSHPSTTPSLPPPLAPSLHTAFMQALQAVEGDSSTLSHRQSALTEELRRAGLDRDRLAAEAVELEADAAAQREAKLELQQRVTALELARDRSAAEVRSARDEQQQTAALLVQAKQATAAAGREKEALAARVAELEGDVARLGDANRDLNGQLRQQHRDYGVAMDCNREFEDEMSNLQRVHAAAKSEIERLKAELRTVGDARDTLQLELDRQVAEISNKGAPVAPLVCRWPG